MQIVSNPEEFIDVELSDIDITLTRGEKLNLTLRPKTRRSPRRRRLKSLTRTAANW
jgi:hypothetical protein